MAGDAVVGSYRGTNRGCISPLLHFTAEHHGQVQHTRCLFPPESERRGICSSFGIHLQSLMEVLRACIGCELAQKRSCLVLVAPALPKVPDRLFLFVLPLDVPGKAEGGARKKGKTGGSEGVDLLAGVSPFWLNCLLFLCILKRRGVQCLGGQLQWQLRWAVSL